MDDHKEINWNTHCHVHLLFVPVHMIALPAHVGKFPTHRVGLITGTTVSRNTTLSGDREARTEVRRILLSVYEEISARSSRMKFKQDNQNGGTKTCIVRDYRSFVDYGCVPLRWSGSESWSKICLDHGASKELMNALWSWMQWFLCWTVNQTDLGSLNLIQITPKDRTQVKSGIQYWTGLDWTKKRKT